MPLFNLKRSSIEAGLYRNVIRLIAAAIQPFRGRLFAISILSALELVALIALPLFVKHLLDVSMTGHTDVILFAFAGLLVLRSFAGACTIYLQQVLGAAIVNRARSVTLANLLAYRMSFFTERTSAAIGSTIINDAGALKNVATELFTKAAYQALKLLIAAAVMLSLNARLALLLILVVPVVTLTCRRFSSSVRDASRLVQDKLNRVSETVHEILRGIVIVKCCCAEETEYSRYQRDAERLINGERNLAFTNGALSGLADLLSSGNLLLLLWAGSHEVAIGQLSAGSFVAFMLYSQQLGESVSQLASFFKDFMGVAGGAQELASMWSHDELREYTGPRPDGFAFSQYDIEFRRVGFSYGCKQVLRDLSFHFQPGEKIAITGPNGIGKTTVFKLILRLADPVSGDILIGGVDITRIDPRLLRRDIAYVPQDCFLFNRSIDDNLERTPESEFSGLEHWERLISGSLADKMDTLIGDNGARLSGGQRQRLAIARALFRRSRILLLDEPTTSLDAASTSALELALLDVSAETTVVFITHDSNLLGIADRILRLDAVGVYKEERRSPTVDRAISPLTRS